MKTLRNQEELVSSVDTRLLPATTGAKRILNFRLDGGAWRNDVGWEPLVPYDASFAVADIANDFGTIWWCGVWSRSQGAEQYYLYHRNGKLEYEWGNQGAASSARVTLSSSWTEPKVSEPGTQLISYGAFALFVNGVDAPFMFWGRARTTGFGWMRAPAAPRVLQVYPPHLDWTLGEQGNLAGKACIPFPVWSTDASATAAPFSAAPDDGDVDKTLGIGSSTANSRNRYGIRIREVSETGSKSPWSEPVYVYWSPQQDSGSYGYQLRKFGIVLTDIQQGRDGIVAIEIARTKDIETAGELYYLEQTVYGNCVDQVVLFRGDEYLQLPIDINDSIARTNNWKGGAAWDSRLWLFDDTLLVYSEALAPEQFSRTGYFEVGVRDGGQITAVAPYKDALVVVRERAIEVVSRRSEGGYAISQISGIGTMAARTIVDVPGIGLVFLSRRGLYAIVGDLYGEGAAFTVANIGRPLEEELRHLSGSAIARACAAYSEREDEYWCLFPSRGSPTPQRGIVIHAGDGVFSQRGPFAFESICADPQGWFILGPHPQYNTSTPTSSTGAPGIGLQVWSQAPYWGHTLSYNSGAETWSAAELPRGTSEWISRQVSPRNDSSLKSKVVYIEVAMVATGQQEVELLWAIDGDYRFTSAGTQVMVVDEVANVDALDDAKYGALAAGQAPVATWGSSVWAGERIVYKQWRVHLGQECSTIQFKLVPSGLMAVISYHIEWAVSKAKVGMHAS